MKEAGESLKGVKEEETEIVEAALLPSSTCLVEREGNSQEEKRVLLEKKTEIPRMHRIRKAVRPLKANPVRGNNKPLSTKLAFHNPTGIPKQNKKGARGRSGSDAQASSSTSLLKEKKRSRQELGRQHLEQVC